MRHFQSGPAIQLVLLACAAWVCCERREAEADPAVYEIGRDPGVGFNLISWSGNTQSSHWQNAIQSMHDAGFREVSIAPLHFVDTFSGAITPSGAPSLSGLAGGVSLAKSLGMRVTLDPFIEPEEFSMWRGFYNPSGQAADTFWSDYEDYLVEVAGIANTYQVDAMTLGTELRAITRDSDHNADWNNAINAVRQVYAGPLGYAANWDNYDHGNVASAIWEHPEISFIGVDSYFSYNNDPLSEYLRSQNPGLSQQEALEMAIEAADESGNYPNQSFIDLMTAAWTHKLQTELLPFAAERKGGTGMPLEFTEIGYLPNNRAAVDPQQQFLPGNQPLDADEQIMAFQGLIQALDGLVDVFPAMHIWQWHMAGSDGSLWNIDPTPPANQPNNIAVGQWLSEYVSASVEPLAGDYNRDGVVNAGDYVVWRNTRGQFVAHFASADGNGNGVVENGDYETWLANFGRVAAEISADTVSLPESTSQILLLLAVVLTYSSLPGRNRIGPG